MKLVCQFVLSFLFFVLLTTTAHPEDASFTASVDRTRVTVGEQFQITFTLSGSTGGRNFRAPAFTDFLPLSGPNQSTSMQFVNGVMNSSVSYSFILQPRSEGKFTIGQASIEVGGKQLQTQPVVIEVSKGTSRQPQTGQQKEDESMSDQIGDDLFLKVTADKSRVYQGEQLVISYKVYTRVNIVNYSLAKVPALTGFWSEELETPQQIQLTNEVINGKQYRVGTLRKLALFPQKSGPLELDPMEVDCVVQLVTRRRSTDVFDQFFNDPFFGNAVNVNKKIRSQPVKITVVPHPQENIPATFSGAVGKFTMEAWLDKNEVKANDAVTLKIKIAGRGNLKMIDAPTIGLPADLEQYDPKISDNITKQDNVISGSRVFEYLIIPRHAGTFRIPAIAFSFFDPDKKTYTTSTSPSYQLTVAGGSDIAAGGTTGLAREDVRLLGEDIRFIKSGHVRFDRTGVSFAGSLLFYLLAISPVVSMLGFIMIMRKRERSFSDVRAFRNRRARKVALTRLKVAERLCRDKKPSEFFEEISRALWGYTGDKLGIQPAELSMETASTRLAERGIPDDTLQQFTETLGNCEFARFAPPTDLHELQRVYEETVRLISTIEERIR